MDNIFPCLCPQMDTLTTHGLSAILKGQPYHKQKHLITPIMNDDVIDTVTGGNTPTVDAIHAKWRMGHHSSVISFMALVLYYGYKTAFRRITSADLYVLFDQCYSQPYWPRWPLHRRRSSANSWSCSNKMPTIPCWSRQRVGSSDAMTRSPKSFSTMI